MDKFDVVVSSAFGTESVTKNELIKLGIRDRIICDEGRCRFSGTIDDAVKCCVFLRTCERVYLKLTQGACTTFDELFALTTSVNWKDILPMNAKLSISAKSVNSKLFALSAIQSVVKKAIVRSLCGNDQTVLPENGADYRLQVAILKDECEILLDMCGTALHRRGYRVKTSVAPIKETLAAAILLLSDYDGDRPLYDPFCGSGTFLTEGAMIAMNIAPGADRRFAFEHYTFIDKKLLKAARERAKDERLEKPPFPILGGDIDQKQLDVAAFHCDKLGVSEYIGLERKNALDSIPSVAGLTVTNPPYGERIMTMRQTAALYRDLGKAFDRYPNGHSLSLITAFEAFEQRFGKKARRTRKLFNGELTCRLYYYEKTKK